MCFAAICGIFNINVANMHLCRFKHAKKVAVDEPPESMEAVRELLSKELHVSLLRVCKFCLAECSVRMCA